MLRMRIAVLMIAIYVLTTTLPYHTILAYDLEGTIVSWVEVVRTTQEHLTIVEKTTPSVIDLAPLERLVEEGEDLVEKAPIGTTPGAYQIEDSIQLLRAIQEAKQALIQIETEEEVMIEVAKLHEALIRFKGSRNVDIGELGLAAYYYGTQSGDIVWEQAIWLDMNCDHIVNISDLTYIALKIMQS